MNKRIYKIEPQKSLNDKMADFQQLCSKSGLKDYTAAAGDL